MYHSKSHEYKDNRGVTHQWVVEQATPDSPVMLRYGQLANGKWTHYPATTFGSKVAAASAVNRHQRRIQEVEWLDTADEQEGIRHGHQ